MSPASASSTSTPRICTFSSGTGVDMPLQPKQTSSRILINENTVKQPPQYQQQNPHLQQEDRYYSSSCWSTDTEVAAPTETASAPHQQTPSPPHYCSNITAITTTVGGRSFLSPSSPFARAVLLGTGTSMGNEPSLEATSSSHGNESNENDNNNNDQLTASSMRNSRSNGRETTSSTLNPQQPRPVSNLTVLLSQHNQQLQQDYDQDPDQQVLLQSSNEADSASGPPPTSNPLFSAAGAPQTPPMLLRRRIMDPAAGTSSGTGIAINTTSTAVCNNSNAILFRGASAPHTFQPVGTTLRSSFPRVPAASLTSTTSSSSRGVATGALSARSGLLHSTTSNDNMIINSRSTSAASLLETTTPLVVTSGTTSSAGGGTTTTSANSHRAERVRRCLSSKELGTIAPPSGSPYAYMLYKKEQLEVSMRQRLQAMRQEYPPPPQQQHQQQGLSNMNNGSNNYAGDESSSTSSRLREGSNQLRNIRRAQHNEAIVQDLCNVVADLFIAESKLLKPFQYGVVPVEEDSTERHHNSSNNNNNNDTNDEPPVAREGGQEQESLSATLRREQVVQFIHNFVSALPLRYALSADTPSEVLLHMRIMAAARADKTKVVVHIHNQDQYHNYYATNNDTAANATDANSNTNRYQRHYHQPSHGGRLSTVPAATTIKMNGQTKQLRLVTICCNDADGLLEFISKLLATGGSRVVDADVMLSTDGIVLDRFLVEMNGRLRMDRLADRIEAFLKEKQQQQLDNGNNDTRDASSEDVAGVAGGGGGGPTVSSTSNGAGGAGGPLYYQAERKLDTFIAPKNLEEEMQSAIPLTHVLASRSDLCVPSSFPMLRKFHSMPPNKIALAAPKDSLQSSSLVHLPMRSEASNSKKGNDENNDNSITNGGVTIGSVRTSPDRDSVSTAGPASGAADTDNLDVIRDLAAVVGLTSEVVTATTNRQRRPLVNRKASSNLDEFESSALSVALEQQQQQQQTLDYVTIPSLDADAYTGENRVIPLIPFDELMLIETLGTGRVSTIYRAAWQRGGFGVQMVALKVAMINNLTGDTTNVDELRREADIAARLSHPNICDLVGVAADPECFCLAYDYCEGGSLLSLLSNPNRYYEYLPIALDVACGMAYLHSRNVIHRDLKPSNILLTRDHRAKIADFGMSVAYNGQELTAETGTYRYMAPEVIRHESYSSNADVYSFGVCLWQLITREIPFATMTPIQAAYAVAEGRRPPIPPSTPRRLQEVIIACWDQDSHKRPSFTYIAMALADYAKMAFSPANVGALTLQIANEMLESVEGNSNVNVDFSTPVAFEGMPPYMMFPPPRLDRGRNGSYHSQGSQNVGLEIE